MNLTVDIIRPAYNSTTGVALPTGPMPVLLGVHGGSYTHGDSSEQVPNVEYFVQRGWVGFSINYRLCHQGPMLPPGATTSPATLSSSDGGNLVCGGYGSFPAVAPFGNVRKPTLRVKKQKAKKNPPSGHCSVRPTPQLLSSRGCTLWFVQSNPSEYPLFRGYNPLSKRC